MAITDRYAFIGPLNHIYVCTHYLSQMGKFCIIAHHYIIADIFNTQKLMNPPQVLMFHMAASEFHDVKCSRLMWQLV